MVTGLAYTMILSLMCVALWRAFKMESGDLDPNGPCFSTGLLDTCFSPSVKRGKRLLIAIFAPWYSMGKAAARLYGGRAWVQMIALATPFYLWILLMILQVVDEGLMYVGWSVLFGFFAYGTGIRADMREKFGINGNMLEDFFAVLLSYPLAAVQMGEHMEIHKTLGDAEMGKDQMAVRNFGYNGQEPKNGPDMVVHQRGEKAQHVDTSL